MMQNIYWSIESWGSGYPPVNADEIISEANAMIDNFVEAHPDYDEVDINEYSEQLWETFCRDGKINDISAIYEEE